jgi:hypothetical protein
MTPTHPTRRQIARGNAFLEPMTQGLFFSEIGQDYANSWFGSEKKRHKHPEQALQRQVAEYLAWALPDPWYFTAVGHGGGGEMRGRILKGLGVKAGVPDLVILGPARFIGWLEMKSPTGRLSPPQVAFRDMALVFGHRWELTRSLDEVRATLEFWHVPTREVKPATAAIRRGFALTTETGQE